MRLIVFLTCFIGIIFFSSTIGEIYYGIASNLLSICFVLGGTLLATLISFPLEKIKRINDIVQKAFRAKKFDYVENTRLVIRIVREYKRRGFKSLEAASREARNWYLELGLQLIADKCEWAQIKATIEKEFVFDNMESDSTQRILHSMSKYAPAFGLAGTIIGLMRVFPQLSQPENIGSAISLALLTTLYGVLLSNLVFLPLAHKLRDNVADDEIAYRYITEALKCIHEQEYSIIIEQRLSALMPKHELMRYNAEKADPTHIRMAENS